MFGVHMMSSQHMSLRYVFLVPAIFAIGMLLMVAMNYFERTEKRVAHEYQRVEHAIHRSVKILTSLDYTLSTHYQNENFPHFQHNSQVQNGVCRIWPIEALILAEDKNLNIPAVDISYMISGDDSMCVRGSALNLHAAEMMDLAPMLSFLHDLDEHILGVHYVAEEGLVISSPDNLANNIERSSIEHFKSLPFWYLTSQNSDSITVTGPIESPNDLDRVLTLSLPVSHGEDFKGVVSLEINTNLLLTSNTSASQRLMLVQHENLADYQNRKYVYPLSIQGVAFEHVLFYQSDLMDELISLLNEERNAVFIIAIIYILTVISLFYLNLNFERRYFQNLAERDPMTGLLNRRGLEIEFKKPCRFQFEGIAVFDIDNFKKINDTYGHEMGDQVICFVADQMRSVLREMDVVSRFGGEEFVVYIRANSPQLIVEIAHRIHNQVARESTKILAEGFTLSGGVCVEDHHDHKGLKELVKSADKKLYHAKESGKNQVTF
ncbi:putative GGDEF family protein [Vibrio nigripulchritudo SFn118]|nr:putative GGDEF family protein [Vibrio nigripulchritudo SFn118]